MALALGLEKGLESAVGPHIRFLEVALIPVGRFKDVKIALHMPPHLIRTVTLGGRTGLALHAAKRG